MSVKCLIYCTKAKPNLYRPFEYDCFEQDETSGFYLSDNPMLKEDILLNGKIVASFDCEKVEEFTMDYRGNEEQNKRIVKDSCLSLCDLVDYQKENHLLYAIHISNLEIFDKPKELNEYMVKAKKDKNWIGHKYIALHKAPQNMCTCYNRYIENHQYVLISIRPEWVAKILNGSKTIEVRKKVVNKLKEMILDE